MARAPGVIDGRKFWAVGAERMTELWDSNMAAFGRPRSGRRTATAIGADLALLPFSCEC